MLLLKGLNMKLVTVNVIPLNYLRKTYKSILLREMFFNV